MVCDLWQNIMLINKYRRRLNDNRIDEIMDEWNTAWSDAQESNGIEVTE